MKYYLIVVLMCTFLMVEITAKMHIPRLKPDPELESMNLNFTETHITSLFMHNIYLLSLTVPMDHILGQAWLSISDLESHTVQSDISQGCRNLKA